MAAMHLCRLLVCVLASAGATDLPPRDPREVNDPEIVKAAEFALEELKKLSDSGIYEALTLKEIKSAATQTGVFHFNYFLTLDIASPHLLSGKEFSTHEVIVMRNLEDNILSFAIDEFPVMDEDAIEEFWIRKVEAHKKMREASFAEMEREYLEQHTRDSEFDDSTFRAEMEQKTSAELRELSKKPDSSPAEVQVILSILDIRLSKLEELEKKHAKEEL